MKPKNLKLISVLSALILLSAVLLVTTLSITGNSIKHFEEEKPFDYVWTSAICEDNECRDYEITCLKGEAIKLDPVSGMVVFPDNWEDKRELNSLC